MHTRATKKNVTPGHAATHGLYPLTATASEERSRPASVTHNKRGSEQKRKNQKHKKKKKNQKTHNNTKQQNKQNVINADKNDKFNGGLN